MPFPFYSIQRLAFSALVAHLACSAIVRGENPVATAASPAAQVAPSTPLSAAKDLLADPKESILLQLKLLQAGNVKELKTCFTPRVRDRVNTLNVSLARSEASRTKPEMLVGKIEITEQEGRKIAHVFSAKGRSVAILIQSDGLWLSDSLWFR